MIRDISQDLSGGTCAGRRTACRKTAATHTGSETQADQPAQNILPVERDSSGRAPKQSQKPFVRISGKSHGVVFVRDGQTHLKAEIHAKLSELRSRIRVLKKAKERTRSWNCSELYRKAIRAAEFDIQELLA